MTTRLMGMLTLNLPFIRSKVREPDMPTVRDNFTRSLGSGYALSVAPRDYSFYTILGVPNSLLVSMDALRIGLSFLLDLFTVEYLQASGLAPIQLTPNSWDYLLSFVKFAR